MDGAPEIINVRTKSLQPEAGLYVLLTCFLFLRYHTVLFWRLYSRQLKLVECKNDFAELRHPSCTTLLKSKTIFWVFDDKAVFANRLQMQEFVEYWCPIEALEVKLMLHSGQLRHRLRGAYSFTVDSRKRAVNQKQDGWLPSTDGRPRGTWTFRGVWIASQPCVTVPCILLKMHRYQEDTICLHG